MNKKVWEIMKENMRNLFSLITGRSTRIIDITSGDEIGFTSEDGNLHISSHHEIMKGLGAEKKKMFIYGVFAHEMLHQIYTNFQAFKKQIAFIKSPFEKQIFANIFNLTEDPAIEYFAPNAFSGFLYKCLDFTISHIYNKAEPLDNCDDAFVQYLNALVMFGDVGFIKGKFTFPEAKEMFQKTCSLFFEITRTPNNEERVKKSYELFEMTKPLWEREAEEQEKLLEKLKDFLDKLQKNQTNGSGSGQSAPKSDSSDSETEKSNRQKEMLKRMEKSAEEGEKSSSPSEDTEKSSGAGDKISDEEDELSFSSVSDDSDESDSNSETESDSTKNNTFNEEEFQNRKALSMPEFTETEMEEFRKSEEMAEKQMEEKERQKREEYNLPATSSHYSGINIKNNDTFCVSDFEKSTFQTIKNRMLPQEKILTRHLKRLFLNLSETKEYWTSGKISTKRIMEQKVTSRLFEREMTPNRIDNFVVGIQIDESGSMSGSNIESARDMAVLLCEVFSSLKIPVYVLGFTDDGNSVIHNHFIKWNYNQATKHNLACLRAYSRNFDGFSIRTMSSILKRRRADHKLHIIISDGTPTGYAYRSFEDGIADTKEAIRDARKQANVIGVLLGNQDVSILHHMYGNDFLHVENPEELSSLIVPKIKKIIQNW